MSRTVANILNRDDLSVTADPRQHIMHYSRHGSPSEVVSFIESCLPAHRRPAWRDYRARWNQADDMKTLYDFPLEVNLELTDNCNLACAHCYQITRTIPRKKVIRLPLYKKIVDECAERNLGSLVLGSTDEALLHTEIVPMVAHAVEKRIPDVWLFTNGTLMTRDQAKTFVALKPTRISISIDAHTPDTYHKIRGGALADVHRAIESLLRERESQGNSLPIIRLTFIRQPGVNLDEIEPFIEHWGKRVDQIDFQTLWDPTWVESLPHEFTAERFNCAQPWKQIMLLANGDILPCCSEYGRHMILGNVQMMRIQEAWYSEKMEEVRRSLITGEYKRACVNCMGHRPKFERSSKVVINDDAPAFPIPSK